MVHFPRRFLMINLSYIQLYPNMNMSFLFWFCFPILWMDIANVPDLKPKPRVVFLVSKDPLNYEADKTIPVFAEKLKDQMKYRVKVIEAKGPRISAHLPEIDAIKKADLLVVFCRRLALKPDQMQVLQDHYEQGKPIVGFRTANHAFTVRETIPDGYVDWADFVPDVLGSENRGYEPEELGTVVRIIHDQKDHPVLEGIDSDTWRSKGQVYKSAPLEDPEAEILLTGSTENVTEPFAWTRITRYGGRVFYTALGYPDDFNSPEFIRLARNGIQWALNEK